MESLVKDIKSKQEELIVMINSTFEAIIKEVSQLSNNTINDNNDFELIFPLTNASGFKSKKVIAVIINDKRYKAPTWKSVVQLILNDAIKNSLKLKKLYALRDKLLGRKRTRLSMTSDEMRSPLKITENLYIETHYDTESLMKLLIEILDEIAYDYSLVKIVIKN